MDERQLAQTQGITEHSVIPFFMIQPHDDKNHFIAE
jgi:hypothetical protein